MKKTLAMLLALMLALGAMGLVAFAEEREPYSFTMYSNIVAELTEQDKKVIGEIASSLNLDIDVQIAPSSNYDESMQLTLASGEYPDMALFSSTTS